MGPHASTLAGAWGADIRSGGSQLGEVDREEVVHDGQRLIWGDLSVGIGW
jgi:hypothetical protein